MGLCHRDLSLENLMVNDTAALVIDFGMCFRVPYAPQSALQNAPTTNNQRLLTTPAGTMGKWHYMSPEIVRNKDPFDGFAIDLWAAGVILFLMLTGFPPWEKADDTDDRFKYMSRGYMVQLLSEWNLGLSSEAMELLQAMLYKDPQRRFSLRQVLQHPWLHMGDQSMMEQQPHGAPPGRPAARPWA
jgi:serine/threonine protein kinase